MSDSQMGVLWSTVSYFLNYFFFFVVVICDQVHDAEALFHIL